MRLIFSIFTAIVVIAAALFFLGPLLISTDAVRAQLLAQVESATGYRLRVDGPVKFSLFPSLDLVAEDVGVSQNGTVGAEIATAKKLRFGLVWSALWGGKVQLTEVTLVDPVIAVPAKTAQAQTQAGADGAASPGTSWGRSAAAALQNLTLDKLVIQNGTVILPPSTNAPGKRIEQLMLEASLPSFDGPLSFDLKAVHEGKPVQAAGSIGNFGPFLSGTPAPVSLAVEAPAHLGDKATVAGTATYQGDSFTLSQFTAKSGDKAVSGNATYQNETLTLSQFTAKTGPHTLTGNAVYKGDTLTINQFTAKAFDAVLTGNATYKGNILTLHPFTAKAYGSNLSGSLAADLSGKIPAINAALTADTINVNA
ncbi:MAG: AsmA family protein, partial [Methyloceanibacter sp.]